MQTSEANNMPYSNGDGPDNNQVIHLDYYGYGITSLSKINLRLECLSAGDISIKTLFSFMCDNYDQRLFIIMVENLSKFLIKGSVTILSINVNPDDKTRKTVKLCLCINGVDFVHEINSCTTSFQRLLRVIGRIIADEKSAFNTAETSEIMTRISGLYDGSMEFLDAVSNNDKFMLRFAHLLFASGCFTDKVHAFFEENFKGAYFCDKPRIQLQKYFMSILGFPLRRNTGVA